ncbi:MAG: serine/threonine protein kinase [Akkermansiaceae bacterium]
MKPADQPEDDFLADEYKPNRLLSGMFEEAMNLDSNGLSGLCPSFTELSSIERRYTKEVFIGNGALKDVYQCYDEKTKRLVALARPRTLLGPDCYDLLIHEAWLTASLKHPNIIKIHDTGVDHTGKPFFTMDLKGNTSLVEFVRKATEQRTLLETFMKVCDAVAYAHSKDVLHLDLKPENIQCDLYGEVLVCDWGLSKKIEALPEDIRLDELDTIGRKTLYGEIKGTPGYMAPEQVMPNGVKDQRTDIFALGCILHYILTSEPPYKGEEKEALYKTANETIVSPGLRYPDLGIPKSLNAVVMKALSFSPEGRYSSVKHLQHEIGSFLAGRTTRVEKPGFIRQVVSFGSRNRLAAAISAVSLVLILLVSGVYLMDLDKHQNSIQREKDRTETLLKKVQQLSQNDKEPSFTDGKTEKETAYKLALFSKKMRLDATPANVVSAIRDARAFVDQALLIDSECNEARVQQSILDCIIMNFQAALFKSVAKQNDLSSSHLIYAELFPQYTFSETERPSINEIAAFYEEAKKIVPSDSQILETILYYDWDSREEKTHYAKIIGHVLECLNEQAQVDYVAKLSELTISVNSHPLVYSFHGDRSVLSLLEVKSLRLRLQGEFDLECLDGSSIQQLDLSQTSEISVLRHTTIKGLKEVRIKPGQLPHKILRQKLISDIDFSILEIHGQN